MPLRGPNGPDEAKLHAEINQIGNQRFVLTTLAITLFGALITFMVPKTTPSAVTGIDIFPFTISVILSVLLFGVYLWCHFLKNMMRILTSYLAETKKSSWELDWIEFRREPYYAHTKPQTIIFLLLNAIGAAFPFLLAAIYVVPITSTAGWVMTLLAFTVTELLILLIGFNNLFDNEAKITKRWNDLNK
jgi:hypothetical protein